MKGRNEKLRCGIIGAGNIAWRYDGGYWDGEVSVTHSSCIDRHDNLLLTAIFEPDRSIHEELVENFQLSGNPVITHKWDEFFGKNLDLVSICSPTDSHYGDLLRCFDHTISYIWLEKPVTNSMSEYRDILDKKKALQYTPRVGVNYFRRNLPQFEDMRTLVRERKTPCYLDISYSRDIAINGVHMLDMLGAILELETAPDLAWLDDEVDHHPSFGFHYDGVTVRVLGYDLPYHAIDMQLTLSDRRVSLKRGGLDWWLETRVQNGDYPGFFHLTQPKMPNTTKKAEQNMRDGTYLNLCNLVNNDEPLQSSVESAYFAQDLLARLTLPS